MDYLKSALDEDAQFDGKLVLWEYGRMKTTVELPDELMRAVKIRAAERGMKLKDVMAEYIELGLKSLNEEERYANDSTEVSLPKAKIETEPTTGLPIIRSPANAPISRMTIEEVLEMERKALEDDDLSRAGFSS